MSPLPRDSTASPSMLRSHGVAAIVAATRSLVLHYGSWREAFAVFQAALFRRDGPPAVTARQERLRGGVDDLVLDYIQYTTNISSRRGWTRPLRLR